MSRTRPPRATTAASAAIDSPLAGPGLWRLGHDRISGGSGKDSLRGDSGKDSLSGNSGRDKLSGGSGKNKLKQ